MYKKLISILLTAVMFYGIYGENTAYADNFDLKSKSAILIDANTRQILYEKEINKILPPASVTKVMTMLLAIEAIDSGRININDKVPTSQHAFEMGGTQIYLEVGEEMSVDDLMKAIAMNSANDASVAIAEFISGTEEDFVNLMNKRAKELGAKNTVFKNASGLPEDGHVTTVYDTALIASELVKHQSIFKYLTDKIDTLRDGKFSLANTNKLLWRYKGADGIKTGSTSEALFCLAATAKRGDTRLIAVVFGAPDSDTRFKEASKLLDYGFANYETIKIASKNEVFGNILVTKGQSDYIKAIANHDEFILLKKDKEKNIKKEINLYKSISAPVKKGTKVGSVKIYDGTKLIKTFDLYAIDNIEKSSVFQSYKKVLLLWLK